MLYDRLERLLENPGSRNPGVAVFYIDLDNFKLVNDTFGHSVGDELLVQVAERLRASLQSEPEMAARLGGDEFVVLLPGSIERETIARRAATVLERLFEPFKLSCGEIRISGSIGIAVAPWDGKLIVELLSRADDALYSAKNKCKNSFAFYQDIPQKAERTVRPPAPVAATG